MNSTMKVTGVVIFGVLLSFDLPHFMNMNLEKKLETESKREAYTENTVSNNDVAIATEEDESGTPIEQPEPVEQVQEPVQTVPEEPQAEPVVYEGMTLNELAEKLNRSLQ